MKLSLAQLQTRRRHLLQQLTALDRLRRGSLSRQFFKKRGQARQGPYYVLQGYCHGRKFSERVPAQHVAQLQPLVANYKRWVQLAEALVTVTDRMTRRTQGPADPKKKPPPNSR